MSRVEFSTSGMSTLEPEQGRNMFQCNITPLRQLPGTERAFVQTLLTGPTGKMSIDTVVERRWTDFFTYWAFQAFQKFLIILGWNSIHYRSK